MLSLLEVAMESTFFVGPQVGNCEQHIINNIYHLSPLSQPEVIPYLLCAYCCFTCPKMLFMS